MSSIGTNWWCEPSSEVWLSVRETQPSYNQRMNPSPKDVTRERKSHGERWPGEVKVLDETALMLQRNKSGQITVPSESSASLDHCDPWHSHPHQIVHWDEKTDSGFNVYVTLNSQNTLRCWLTDILVHSSGSGTRSGGFTKHVSGLFETWGGEGSHGEDLQEEHSTWLQNQKFSCCVYSLQMTSA